MKQDDSTVLVRCVGAQVRMLREAAGMTRAQLGRLVDYSEHQVKSVEIGQRIPSDQFIDKADEVLGAKGLLTAFLPYLTEVRYPKFFAKFPVLEAKALSVHSYQAMLIPGLLQTEEYARALFRTAFPPPSDDVIEKRVTARLDRQEILKRQPPPLLGYVIEESALRRPVGGVGVLKRQLRRLLECASMRNVSIQVMPTVQENHAGLNGPMVLLELPDQELVYIESQADGIFISDRAKVRAMNQRYGILRAQALSPGESATFIEKWMGEL
ncbi:helix-turn-helix domain-containing protein [Allostreptomyces psammosilenae]|uniref:Transcriptional regulator with XRE-family HTH domain n=1 Tax=Allostreptomyces psammosilenae TaxID=1892865 RepID=A0A852ZXL9_9ACTN|nr:helix-turn-helix transcriptional regulator [Allostreptomyces psammosilenae]NYI03381.1 transcriptional regulator with XRE-family HTH domain [Allostreptomyces psammosilenae]